MDVVPVEVRAGILAFRELAENLSAQNAELMAVVKTPGVSSEVVVRSFAEFRRNNVMLANASFMVVARAWKLESAVSLGLAIKLHAENYENMTEEVRKASWAKVTEQLGVVCAELNGMSVKSVEEAKKRIEDETRESLAREVGRTVEESRLSVVRVGVEQAKAAAETAEARLRVARAEAEGVSVAATAKIDSARAEDVERDLRRKKMSVFRRFGLWLAGES
jgi:hypothetical protein